MVSEEFRKMTMNNAHNRIMRARPQQQRDKRIRNFVLLLVLTTTLLLLFAYKWWWLL